MLNSSATIGLAAGSGVSGATESVSSHITKNRGIVSALINPKRIAFGVIGTIQLSLVSMTGYSIMMGIDALLHVYLVVTMILKQLGDQSYSDTINVF